MTVAFPRPPHPESPLADAMLAPIVQAARCLDIWLAEEGRSLPPRQKNRAAALLARYFEHEEGVSDTLILSFLRHYGGFGEVDLEDPRSVRMEIKAVLDKAAVDEVRTNASGWRPIAVVCLTLCVIALLAASAWLVAERRITQEQQAALRASVDVVALREGKPHAAVWAQVKRRLGVTRYQEIRWLDYGRAQDILSESLPPQGAGR